jgi:hypothetical protein
MSTIYIERTARARRLLTSSRFRIGPTPGETVTEETPTIA